MGTQPVAPNVLEREEAARISTWFCDLSLEATRPSNSEIMSIPSALHGTRIYLPIIPSKPYDELIAAAIQLREAGFEPVPHLAARSFTAVSALEKLIAQLTGDAGVQQVLLIGGDKPEPAGPFRSAQELLDSGLLRRYGIKQIGIAGYPEGHPSIPDWTLRNALEGKIQSAQQGGLKVNIVSQFCFDPLSITNWILQVRNRGFDHEIRIGLAGPTNLMTLLRYIRLCGVKASAQGLARQSHLGRQLFRMVAPDAIVRSLAKSFAAEDPGDTALHFFTFGGVGASARWAAAARAGKITLNSEDGFQVLAS